jgi:hypothetical protein
MGTVPRRTTTGLIFMTPSGGVAVLFGWSLLLSTQPLTTTADLASGDPHERTERPDCVAAAE